MKILATKTTTNICKRVASNVDKILFQRNFQELLVLQGEVAHQKHRPIFSGHLCFLFRCRLRLLNFSLVWFIPTIKDFMIISSLQNWLTFLSSSLHCINYRRGTCIKKKLYNFFLFNFCCFLYKIFSLKLNVTGEV